MSRADGVHSSTCLHIAEPCDRPSCSWCSCDDEPLADWERDLLNEADTIAILTAERDAARDIAARLEAQLAAVADLHRPQPIYDECERDCPDHGIPLNYYTGCPDRITVMACRHCCLDANGDQTEDCATYHDHTEHTCPTAAVWAIPRDDTDTDAVIAEGEL